MAEVVVREITLYFYRCIVPFLIVFGLIGHSLNVVLFTRRALLSNSCCNYYLAAACAAVIQIIFGQPFVFLRSGFNITFPNIWWCRVRNFCECSAYLISASFIGIASIDRFFSSCSQVKYRQWATVKVARCLFPIVIIVSCAIQAHILFMFEVAITQHDECWASNKTVYGLTIEIIFLVFHGLFYPLLTGTFGFLTVFNIRRRRHRHDHQYRQGCISPLRYHRIRDFQRMTLVQTACTIILTLPFGIYKLYGTVTRTQQKNTEQLAWEGFGMCLVQLLWFFNEVAGFYIYSLSSTKFRHELIKFLKENQCQQKKEPIQMITRL
jgi:hypothetical protein